MKIFFLSFLLTFPAFALNESLLGMPENKSYMNFVLRKYLQWNREQFKFPEDTPFMNDMINSLDHWLVKGTPYYQITFTHGVDDSKKYFQKIRIFIVPELRRNKELLGTGLPSGKEPWFFEKDDSGKTCLLFKESETLFRTWCRKSPGEKYVEAGTEERITSVPENWPFPFPYLGTEFIRKTGMNGEKEIFFSRVAPHPSRMPAPLYRPVYLNTKDALFPLDRVSTSQGGGMSVHYP